MRGDKATVAVADASHDPHAYEFVRPERMGAILEDEPVAFLPVGCLEYHGPHLPLGVDMLTADAICHRTAVVTGGVVLPPFWLASGVLPLPHGIVVDLDVLRTAIRPILRQLAEGGFEVIVVVSGHGALDHLHVLREETDRIMEEFPAVNALTTVWNELNTDLDGDIHDHGAKVETSYLMEYHPSTVDLTTLEDDPAAKHVGVYAANPRFTASRKWGKTMSDHAVRRLAGLISGYRAGERADSWALLRELVTRLQAGDLDVVAYSGVSGTDGTRFELHNPHGQSKYITAIRSLAVDGEAVDLSRGRLSNPSVGEGHTDTAIADLGPLSGFYVRRDQNMVIELPDLSLTPGRHAVAAAITLTDVVEIGAEGELVISEAG